MTQAAVNPCRIVADSDPHAAPHGHRTPDFLDETEFSELAELHGKLVLKKPIGNGSQ